MKNLKKLYLMRHATSDWPSHVATDFERPLTQKGEEEAQKMALYLYEKGLCLDRMIVSEALRTRSTASFLQEKLQIKESIFTDVIYETTHEHLFELICKTDDAIDSLLILSHNPAISMLTTLFLGTYAELPPAVVVEILFDTPNWKDISREKIVYDRIETPLSL